MAEVEAVQIIAESLKQQVRCNHFVQKLCIALFCICGLFAFLRHGIPLGSMGADCEGRRGSQNNGSLSYNVEGTCLLCKVQNTCLALLLLLPSPPIIIILVHKRKTDCDKARVFQRFSSTTQTPLRLQRLSGTGEPD